MKKKKTVEIAADEVEAASAAMLWQMLTERPQKLCNPIWLPSGDVMSESTPYSQTLGHNNDFSHFHHL